MSLPALALCFALAGSPSLIWSEQAPDGDGADFFSQSAEGDRRLLARIPASAGFLPFSAVAPDGSALVAVSLVSGRDRARGGTLFRIRLPGGEVRELETGVAYTRPLALPRSGAVFLRLTGEHPAPPEASRRGLQDLATTEVRWVAEDGPSTRVASDQGHGLHLAGIDGERAVVYRVAPDEAAFYLARLVPGGGLRRLAAAPTGATARDFTVGDGQLFFASPTPDRRTHAVFALDLASAQVRQLLAADSDHLSPRHTARGLVFTRPSARGESLASWDPTGARPLLTRDAIPFPLAADGSGRLIALRLQDADSQRLWLFDRALSRAVPLDTRGFFSAAGFADLP